MAKATLFPILRGRLLKLDMEKKVFKLSMFPILRGRLLKPIGSLDSINEQKFPILRGRLLKYNTIQTYRDLNTVSNP